MVKYISTIVQDFKQRLTGIKENSSKWATQHIKQNDVEDIIAQLELAEEEIEAAEAALLQKRNAARTLVNSCAVKLEIIDRLAEGIHMEEKIMLVDYGITPRKSRTTQKNPDKSFIVDIKDNVDGIGFIVSIKRVQKASRYEIQRGIASNADEIMLSPPFPFFKTSTKITFIDTNIEKGKRYFYRVRAVNSAGAGEWSEVVNRIQ